MHQFLLLHDPVSKSFMLPKTPITDDLVISMEKIGEVHDFTFTLSLSQEEEFVSVMTITDLYLDNVKNKVAEAIRWYPLHLLDKYPDIFEKKKHLACLIFTGRPAPIEQASCVDTVKGALALSQHFTRLSKEMIDDKLNASHCSTLNGNSGSFTNTDDLASPVVAPQWTWQYKPRWGFGGHQEYLNHRASFGSLIGGSGGPFAQPRFVDIRGGYYNQARDLGNKYWDEVRSGSAHVTGPGEAFHNEKLSGTAGSWTNTDDLKKGVKTGKMTKPAKKGGKKGPKASKSEGIINGLMPTVFQNQFDVKPYYKTVSAGKYSRRIKTLFSVGTIGGTGPVGANSTYINGGVLFSVLIAKELFAGQNAAQDFENFERHQHKSQPRYHILPSVGSTTPGSIWALPDPDGIDQLPIGSTITPSVLNGHRNSQKHTLWAGQTTGQMVVNKAKLFTDAELVSFSSLTTTVSQQQGSVENRFYCAGVFSILNGDGIPTTQTTTFAEVFLEFDIEFSEPQNSDIGFLVENTKCSANSGNFIGSYTSGVATDPSVNIIKNFTAVTAINAEYTYNPNSYTPAGATSSFYSLPVGMYMAYLSVGFTSTPTVTGTSTNVVIQNAVFSEASNTYYEAADVWASPEFTQPPATSASCPNSLVATVMFRITQVTTGNRAKVAFLPSLTFTGTANYGNFHKYVMRLPDFGSMPSAMFFPIGNGNNNVSLLSDGFDEKDEKEQDYKKRWKLTLTNGINNPAIVTIDGLTYDDLSYYEHKYRKKFPELNWSSESESTKNNISISVLPKQNWPKNDLTKYHEKISSQNVANPAVWVVTDPDLIGVKDELENEKKVVEEPDSPLVIENPLTKSIHVDPSLAAKFLSVLAGK